MTPWFVAIVAAAGVTLLGSPSPQQTPKPPAQSVTMGETPKPPAQPVKPAAAISCDVMVLHATNDNSGIDPRLGKMPALSKPPFSSYNSYKLLDQTNLPLNRGQAAPLQLPTGRELRLVYKDVIDPPKAGDALRYVVTASIQKPDGKSFLPLVEVNAKAGEWFWVGGQEYKGGSLFIGIKVGP